MEGNESQETIFDVWKKIFTDWKQNQESLHELAEGTKNMNKMSNFGKALKGGEVVIQTLEMPEPYLGSRKDIDAVMININPGSSDKCKNCKHARGFRTTSGITYFKCFYNDYDDYANPFPYLRKLEDIPCVNMSGGREWWEDRREWLNRITGINKENVGDFKIFALEMFPYHTKTWPGFNVNKGSITNSEVCKYIKDVFDLAADVIRNSRSEFKVGFIIGKTVYDTIIKIGGDQWQQVMICEVTKDTKNEVSFYEDKNPFTDKTLQKWQQNIQANWPHTDNKNTIKTKRSYALLFNRKTKTYFLCTWAPGGNKAPSDKFNDVEKSICEFVEAYINAHKDN